MPLDLRDCTFFGPALPEPFVKFQLEGELGKRKLLPRTTGDEGRALEARWEAYRRKLRALGEQGGDRRVSGHVLEPLAERLGYEQFTREAEVITREGAEDGGWLFATSDRRVLRAWAVGLGTDLDAPTRRGRAYRFSPSRVAQRVLLAMGERVGLLTDGEELRLLLCDPARPDSHIVVRLDRSGGWRAALKAPDSYRLLLALASPAGVATLPELAEAARLAQSTVTRKLRLQARRAIEGFIQEVLDHPENGNIRAKWTEPSELARTLWREGLVLVYRLLFVFKLESAADPARAFSFAATSLWRNSYSPNTALAPLVRKVLDQGADSGGFLESGLRTLWRMFAGGMSSSELEVKALGGMLFGEGTTPLLDRLCWGERAVARLLDALLWTPADGKAERERVHYGALDVEDLGRVYEALLELDPGITGEPMCRLRRAKLEVVVPVAQGAAYRAEVPASGPDIDADEADEDDEEQGDQDEETLQPRGKAAKTQVQLVEEIPAGRFFLRVGLGRKASGSYYTPHPFVRFLVQETLGPQLAERSPKEDPRPERILGLKVLDPAMGSGHFLVEACRYLGEALYEACRLCDELAVQAEEQAERAPADQRERLLARAAELRGRVGDLPDPEDELVAYLPSRASEGEESGLSQKKAEALCRRLVAVHCLYGVDKNPLAVELAKLSLWLESYAEGLPLTFMDHRLVCGDSLTGPFFEHLLTYPRSGAKLDNLFAQGLTERLQAALAAALGHVRDLEATVGKDVADLEQKRSAKEKLDAALAPLKLLAAAWSGGVMLGDEGDDAAYQALAQAVVKAEDISGVLAAHPHLREMVLAGKESVAFELAFPEVFHPGGGARHGFDVVLGNPPWDAIQFKTKEFLAAFDLAILDAPTKRERTAVEKRLLSDSAVAALFAQHQEGFERAKRANDRLYEYQKVIIDDDLAGRQLDAFRVFMERNAQLLGPTGFTGVVVPSAFHANAGATGVRQLYLEKMALRCCFSFENRKKLFDIDSRFKFAAVVAQNDPAGTREFECGFYWHDLGRLFEPEGRLRYSIEFVRKTGGEYLTLLEGRDEPQVVLLNTMYRRSEQLGSWMSARGIVPNTSELPMLGGDVFIPAPSDDVRRPEVAQDLVRRGFVPLHEGKTLHQFDDLWETPPRYVVRLAGLQDRPRWLQLARHFRFGYRAISSSTNERTGIACLMPPPSVSTRKVASDIAAGEHPNSSSLLLCAVFNSHVLDFALRLMVQTDVGLFIVKRLPFPVLEDAVGRFLVHSALRLNCNHAGYAPLWTEQNGEEWREPRPMHTWPVIEGDGARWAVRAAIDAVVADAYGLDREQYAHVLSTFSHKSYPQAPDLCLAVFDELQAIGLEAFARKHDPYWDIPLNESLPKPVIDLPVPILAESAQTDFRSALDRTEATASGPPPSADARSPRPAELPEPSWIARTPIDRQVLVLSRVVEAHQRADRLQMLGNVKAEKIVHLIESHAGIDLDREPVREAAGPADFPRLKKVVHRAARLHAFSVAAGSHGKGGQWAAGGGLRKRVREYEEVFAAERPEIDRIIDLFVPMDSARAEIVATLYACWNDLLAQGIEPDDSAIIEEFHRWGEGKLRFEADRLDRALQWMREQRLNPTGRAKRTTPCGGRRPGYAGASQARQDAAGGAYGTIVRLLEQQGVVTSRDAQAATDLDAAGVRPHLKRLVDEGRAVTDGERRGMKYRKVLNV